MDRVPPRTGLQRGVTIATRIVYGLFGAFYLILGVTVLLLGTGVLPVWLHDRIFEIGHHTPDTMHLIQETGTLWVLVGMLLIWFTRQVDRSATFHWAFTFFLALDGWVHWFTAYGTFENEPRAIINAIPFAVFLVLGLLRRTARV